MEEVIDWETSQESDYISKADLQQVYTIYCGIYRIPVENYDIFCKRIKKINTLVVDKEEIQIAIGQTSKSLGEKDAQGNLKQTPCWIPIKLTDDYNRELLEAKAKQAESQGREQLD